MGKEPSGFMYDVTVQGGKYRFTLDNTGVLACERNGQEWIPRWETGAKALIPLMDGEEKRQETEDLVRRLYAAANQDDADLVYKRVTVLDMLFQILSTLSDEPL